MSKDTGVEPLAVSYRDACKLLGVGLSTIHRNRARLDIRKIGRRSIVTLASLRALIETAPKVGAPKE